MRIESRTFHGPWFVICEGPGDKCFLDRLLQHHGLREQFDVAYPSAQGRGAIPKGLTTFIETSVSFQENVRGIIIVSDNDEDMAVSLKELTDGLKKEKKFKPPTAVQQLSRTDGLPPLAILMIPIGQTGNLESICLPGAYQKWGLKNALDAYLMATPANGWTLGKQSKMRMTAMIAATCAKKPDANFATHWQEPTEFHVPVDNPSFDGLVTFFRDFPALVDV